MTLVFVFTTAVGIAFWVHLGASTEQNAQKVWRSTTAEVIRAYDPPGGISGSYRIADLRYADFYGKEQTVSNVELPAASNVGSQEPIAVSSDNRLWIKNNLREFKPDPRHIGMQTLLVFVVIAIVTSLIAGFIATVIAMILVAGVAQLFVTCWRFFTKPALMQLTLRKIKRTIGRIYDGIKLRWEFYRRRKRIRPSPAYKLLRKLQTELARMDPTPTVITVRRRANAILTRVLERDNERIEVIEGLIEDLRQEIDLDRKARRQAHEELRGSM